VASQRTAQFDLRVEDLAVNANADRHGTRSTERVAMPADMEGRGDWWPRIPLSRRYRTVASALLLSDVVCAVAGLLLAHFVLAGWAAPQGGLLGLMIVVPLAWIASFHAFGLYSVRHLSAVEEFRRLVGATCVATSLVALVRAWSNVDPYRKWLLITWLMALAFELITRRAWRWQLAHLRRAGHLACRTVILGTNTEAERLGRALSDPSLGFEVIGYVRGSGIPPDPAPLAVVGSVEDLDGIVRALGVECIFVAATGFTADDMVVVAQVARRRDVEIRVTANLAPTLTSRLSIQRVGDLLSLSVKPTRTSLSHAAAKRAFDLSVASVALLVSLPLLVATAMVVRLTSRGPILFRQERVTKDGRVFVMLKFRTMVERKSLPGERVIDLREPFFKLPEDDPRLTRPGRWLRRLSLDELPQLLQVVRGDLSIVGPRPLPVESVTANPDLMSRRHEVRAGITGWWQINGRSSLNAEEAIENDVFYIENWSLSLDLFILLKTVGAVLSRRGAR
jgi:exopolysaccharide biosynthesis polyprenyl glycosylphosphotransferase